MSETLEMKPAPEEELRQALMDVVEDQAGSATDGLVDEFTLTCRPAAHWSSVIRGEP